MGEILHCGIGEPLKAINAYTVRLHSIFAAIAHLLKKKPVGLRQACIASDFERFDFRLVKRRPHHHTLFRKLGSEARDNGGIFGWIVDGHGPLFYVSLRKI